MAMTAYLTYFLVENWAIVLVVFTTFYVALYFTKKPKNFPPGPRGFPIFGVAPLVGKRPEIVFTKWSKEYGEVIGLKLGNDLTVVLNSFDAIQEAFVKTSAVFSHRPNNFIFSDVMRKKGVGFEDYTPEYMTERKFMHTALSRLGFGKTSLEERIMDEALHLIEQFGDANVEVDAEAKEKLMYSIGNVIAQVVNGKRYSDFHDREFRKLMDGFAPFLRTGSIAVLVTIIFPMLIHVPPIRGISSAIKRGIGRVMEVIRSEIAKHKENLDGMCPVDFIDEYLIEINKKTDPDKKKYSKEMMECAIRDLFGAGTETVMDTILFSFIVLANRPECMKKILDEIDDVVGSAGKPRYALREKMPLCQAFIREVMRYRTLFPLSVPHCTSENVQLRGYDIPKGTSVLANIYAVHNDPNNWDKPEDFNLERHLDGDGKLNVSKYFIPFGSGARLCIGRRLAEVELFIFFVTIFQRYSVIPSPTVSGERPHVFEDSDITGMTLSLPTETPVTLVRRKVD